MNISFENALGVHERALNLRTQKAEVLANNLANADTPGYKARDFDFRAALEAAESDAVALQTTRAGHIPAEGEPGAPALLYRTPAQPSLDGNTVEAQSEMARYMRNAMEFQASFQFLNGRLTGLRNAITGGQ